MHFKVKSNAWQLGLYFTFGVYDSCLRGLKLSKVDQNKAKFRDIISKIVAIATGQVKFVVKVKKPNVSSIQIISLYYVTSDNISAIEHSVTCVISLESLLQSFVLVNFSGPGLSRFWPWLQLSGAKIQPIWAMHFCSKTNPVHLGFLFSFLSAGELVRGPK